MPDEKIKIYIGDSKRMNPIEDEGIDFIVSGPPYWDHLIYSQDEQQIGNIHGYNDYLKALTEVWKECYRVLKHGRFMGIIAHDIYTKGDNTLPSFIPLHTDILKSCTEAKFVPYNLIILDIYPRTTRTFLPEDKKADFRRRQFITPRLRYLLVLRKGVTKLSQEMESKLIEDYWNPIWSDVKEMTFLGSKSIFNLANRLYSTRLLQKIIPRKKVEKITKILSKKNHHEYPATDSINIVERAISLYTKKDDVVLDPFIGSGTTAIAASRLGRKCIGYDINKDILSVIKKRLEGIDFKLEFDKENK